MAKVFVFARNFANFANFATFEKVSKLKIGRFGRRPTALRNTPTRPRSVAAVESYRVHRQTDVVFARNFANFANFVTFQKVSKLKIGRFARRPMALRIRPTRPRSVAALESYRVDRQTDRQTMALSI